MEARDRLRIAIQKSGRLTEPSLELLNRCGLSFRISRDKLFCYGETFPIDLLLVRDDDIPGLIAQGVCELGLVGRNVAHEVAAGERLAGREPGFVELRNLGYGPCRLSIAVPEALTYAGPQSLAGLKIATSYPNLLMEWLAAQGVAATPVVLNGAVEIAPKLGTADAICDLVSSGATLAANQLVEVAEIMRSESVLIGTQRAFTDERGELLAQLLRRLDGVLKLRESKLLMLSTSAEALPEVLKLLPRAELPRVLKQDGSGHELAVHAICHEAVTWNHLEALKRAGAHHLWVLPVEKMLA
jgi:ATP phosphoribosyltransferase